MPILCAGESLSTKAWRLKTDNTNRLLSELRSNAVETGVMRSRLLKESRDNHAGSDRQLCSAIAHYGLLI